MPTARARLILDFLFANVDEGLETIEDARRFVKRLDLEPKERLFLEVALRDHMQMKTLCELFPM